MDYSTSSTETLLAHQATLQSWLNDLLTAALTPGTPADICEQYGQEYRVVFGRLVLVTAEIARRPAKKPQSKIAKILNFLTTV